LIGLESPAFSSMDLLFKAGCVFFGGFAKNDVSDG
jgi:hypothetical protein